MAQSYATSVEVFAIAPEFATVSTALVDALLSLGEACIGLVFYGDKASDAHALLTAHMLYLHPSAGGASTPNGAQMSGMSDGPASVSWAIPSTGGMDEWLATSPYGKMLEGLNGTLHHKSCAALARDADYFPGGIA